jgi:acetyl esterase/lipase
MMRSATNASSAFATDNHSEIDHRSSPFSSQKVYTLTNKLSLVSFLAFAVFTLESLQRIPVTLGFSSSRRESQQASHHASSPTAQFTSYRQESMVATTTLFSSYNTVYDKSPARTVGDWEEVHGNFLLRPNLEDGPPRALIHFLGGALVGASPHLTYRYFLERLAAKGFLIVATPYSLSFDHLRTCDAVIARFELIAADIARQYGGLPVVGVGHSAGALLQLLITSLFPDTPRAANVLMSYNNKPITEAVPVFEEVFVPFFTYAATRNEVTRASGSEAIRVSLELLKAATVGHVPSDDLITRATRVLTPFGLGDFVVSLVNGVTGNNDNDYKSDLYTKSDIRVPAELRDALEQLLAPTTLALTEGGLIPTFYELWTILEQIPLLIDEVADGARDFIPTPAQVQSAARRAYRARQTLLIQYTDDPIDESDRIEELLRAAGQVIQMKRPMVEINIERRNLPGGHAAPLLAPPLDVATRVEDLLGPEAARENLRYSDADRTVQELITWLEQSNL